MPDFLLGDSAQCYVAPLVYPARAKPAVGDFEKLLGGTNAEVQLGENDVTTKEFDSDLWEDGVVAALSWNVPWQGNWRATDPAYAIVESTALAGIELYLELRPMGTGSGLKVWEGVASITGFRHVMPADNIITNAWTFRGRGPLTPGTQA